MTFTPSVKAAQEHYGTRQNYARFEAVSDFHGLLDVKMTLSRLRDGFYTATAFNETASHISSFAAGRRGF